MSSTLVLYIYPALLKVTDHWYHR